MKRAERRVRTRRRDLLAVLLTGREAEAVEKAFRKAGKGRIPRLEKAVGEAVAGRGQAVGRYVDAARELVEWLLEEVHRRYPERVGRVEGELVILDGAGREAPLGRRLLERGALDAPFSAWVERHGAGAGTALYFLDRVRTSVRGLEPLALAGPTSLPHWEIGESEAEAFAQQVQQELERTRRSTAALARLMRLFDLNQTELGRLFGTSRQAVAEWLRKGVPPAREPKLRTLVALGELLSRRLKPETLPAVVRRPAAVYDGRTILEMVAADRHEEVLAATRGAFDWAATA